MKLGALIAALIVVSTRRQQSGSQQAHPSCFHHLHQEQGKGGAGQKLYPISSICDSPNRSISGNFRLTTSTF